MLFGSKKGQLEDKDLVTYFICGEMYLHDLVLGLSELSGILLHYL